MASGWFKEWCVCVLQIYSGVVELAGKEIAGFGEDRGRREVLQIAL